MKTILNITIVPLAKIIFFLPVMLVFFWMLLAGYDYEANVFGGRFIDFKF